MTTKQSKKEKYCSRGNRIMKNTQLIKEDKKKKENGIDGTNRK